MIISSFSLFEQSKDSRRLQRISEPKPDTEGNIFQQIFLFQKRF